MPGRERDITLHVRTDSDSRGLVNAARDLERLGRGADSAGDNFRGLSRDADALNNVIAETEARVKDLGVQFARTGDRGLFGDLRKERSFLAELHKISKELDHEGSALGVTLGSAIGSSAGPRVSAGIIDSVAKIPSVSRGSLIGAAVGLAVVLAPALGAAVAGAVTGAVGLGGIAGGIAAASKDAGVRQAAREFGQRISTEFFESGGAFVEPTIDALDILADAFDKLNLRSVFAEAAPFVEDVARGIAGLATEFMPGFARALKAAGPVFDALARELPQFGDALGDMFADIAENEGTVQGLIFLMDALSGTARALGATIHGLTNAFEFNVNASLNAADAFVFLLGENSKLGGVFAETRGHLEKLTAGQAGHIASTAGMTKVTHDYGISAAEAQKRALGLGSSTDIIAAAAKTLADEMREANRVIAEHARNAFQSEDANLAFQEGLDRLRESVKDGNKSLSIYNDEGRENRRTLGDIVGAAYDARDAIIAEGNGTETARRKGDTQFNLMIAKARETALKLGLPKAAVDDIIAALNKIPAKKEPKVALTGVEAALSKAAAVKQSIQAIPTYKSSYISVHTRYTSSVLEAKGRQHGGSVFAGQPYIVGEKRPELFVPNRDGRIVPKVPTGKGGSVPVINLTIHAGLGADPLAVAKAMAEALAPYVKKNGGNGRILGIKTVG